MTKESSEQNTTKSGKLPLIEIVAGVMAFGSGIATLLFTSHPPQIGFTLAVLGMVALSDRVRRYLKNSNRNQSIKQA